MKVNSTKTKYKIILLGDQNVGKTAIINRFINNSFFPSYDSTIGIDFLVKNMMDNDKNYRLQLWDTAGQQRFKSLIPSYLKDSSCCLIVYDVNNFKSFQNAYKWLELYNNHKSIKAMSFLVGNKIDLLDQKATESIELKKQKKSQIKHFKVSAKQGIGIEEMFKGVVREMDLFSDTIKSRNKEVVNEREEIVSAQPLKKVQDKILIIQDNLLVESKSKKKCCA